MYLHLLPVIILFSFPTVFVLAETGQERDLNLSTGSDLIENSRFEEAISYFDKILETNSTDIDALSHKITALVKLDKIEQAEFLFEKIMQTYPIHVESLVNFGSLLYESEKYYQAVPYLSKAVETGPKNDALNDILNDALEKSTKRKKIDGVLEISLHDYQGNFVAYYKTGLTIIDHEYYENKISEEFKKKIYIKNNQPILQLSFISIIGEDTPQAAFGLNLPNNPAMWIVQAVVPYMPAVKGDFAEIIITIVEPSYIS